MVHDAKKQVYITKPEERRQWHYIRFDDSAKISYTVLVLRPQLLK